MKKIRVLTLEINHEKNLLEKKLRWIEPDIILESMQKIIGCRAVDARSFAIKGRQYDVWFDDEFLAHASIPTFLLDEKTQYPSLLMGNLLFARANDDGSTAGLQQDDIFLLSRYVDDNFTALRYYLQNGKNLR